MGASFAAAVVATTLIGVDDRAQRAVVGGHTLRIDRISTASLQVGANGKAVKHVSITFEVEPKDVTKSFAYEIGQRFVARDAAGKEVPLGRAHSIGFRTPAFHIAGCPPAAKDERAFPSRDSLTVTIPLLKPDVKSIATLEGDLFMSDVEALEFTFSKDELNSNTIKRVGAAEAKLFLFDEVRRGVDLGFKLKLPVHSRPEALIGGHGFGREHFLLFVTQGARKSMLHSSGGGGGQGMEDDPRVRLDLEFQSVAVGPTPDALHLVIPQVEPPRRHVFRLNDVPIPPPPQRRGAPPGSEARKSD